MTKRTTSEMMQLILSAIAAVALSPLVYLRYVNGDYLLAVINAFIFSMLCFSCVYIYFTRKVETAKILLTTVVAFSILVAMFAREIPHLYWLYPTFIAFYYVLSERIATVFCLSAISAVAIKLFHVINTVNLLSILLSLCLTSIFAYVIFRNYRKQNEKLVLLATIDPLTRASNRRALDDKLANIIAQQKRTPYIVCLLLIDIDFFKKINDEYSHSVGDAVLVEITKLILEHTRTMDTLFRYGGEEFIIAPLEIELTEASVIAEKLRLIVEQHKFSSNISLTISVGVAKYRFGEKAETWIHRADSALYVAKNTGRNKVVPETEIPIDEPA